MGMFDTVCITCPKCGHRNEIQSKAGECHLIDYELHNCPTAIIGVLEHDSKRGELKCEECGINLIIDVQKIATVRVKNE